MGWSILWIMMLHFTFNQIKPLGFIAQYGFAGVDIFIMVSGFGLYCSLDKDSDILHFYKKRVLRIFPTYYLIGYVDHLLFFHDNFLTFLYKYTTIGFWTGNSYAEWFVPSILMLYLISPLIKMIIDRKWFVILGFITFILFLIAYYFTDKEYIFDRAHFFFIYRIPAFIFGMLCAYWIKQNASNKYYFIFLIAGIPCFLHFFPQHHYLYIYKYYSLAFLLPLFTFLMILLSKITKFTYPLLSKIGQASLEIYLIQGMFFALVLNGVTSVYPTYHDTISFLMIITSVIIGIVVHWAIQKIGIHHL